MVTQQLLVPGERKSFPTERIPVQVSTRICSDPFPAEMLWPYVSMQAAHSEHLGFRGNFPASYLIFHCLYVLQVTAVKSNVALV